MIIILQVTQKDVPRKLNSILGYYTPNSFTVPEKSLLCRKIQELEPISNKLIEKQYSPAAYKYAVVIRHIPNFENFKNGIAAYTDYIWAIMTIVNNIGTESTKRAKGNFKSDLMVEIFLRDKLC